MLTAIWTGIKVAAKYWYFIVIGLLILYIAYLKVGIANSKVTIANDNTKTVQLTDSNTSLQSAAKQYNQSVGQMQTDSKAIMDTAASATVTAKSIQTQKVQTIVQIKKEVVPSDCEAAMKNLVVSLKQSDQTWSK
jgi:cell division protein FtsB